MTESPYQAPNEPDSQGFSPSLKTVGLSFGLWVLISVVLIAFRYHPHPPFPALAQLVPANVVPLVTGIYAGAFATLLSRIPETENPTWNDMVGIAAFCCATVAGPHLLEQLAGVTITIAERFL